MPTTPADKAAKERRRELAEIHVIASKNLLLDRDTYVSILQRVAGVSTAADLDSRGRKRVIAELRRLRDQSKPHQHNALSLPNAPKDVREELTAMISKVGALLAEMNKGWNYAHGTARRMFGAERVEWLRPDQLHRVVAALQMSANRRK